MAIPATSCDLIGYCPSVVGEVVSKDTPDFSHDEEAQKFIREMKPENAFVSYKWLGDIPKQGAMMLTHIEVPQSARGTGLGARFAKQILTHLQNSEQEIHISCSFMRRVASTKPAWRKKFNLED